MILLPYHLYMFVVTINYFTHQRARGDRPRSASLTKRQKLLDSVHVRTFYFVLSSTNLFAQVLNYLCNWNFYCVELTKIGYSKLLYSMQALPL